MPRYPIRFAFTPGESERVEAVVTAPRPTCSIVHGTVYDLEGCRIKDAVVRLFACDNNEHEPVADAVTDEDGEFVFGPLQAQQNYLIKVYVDGVTLNEITVRPRRKRAKTQGGS